MVAIREGNSGRPSRSVLNNPGSSPQLPCSGLLPVGKLRSRHVIIEFKDFATAVACYRSPEYGVAAEKRKGRSDMDLVIVEGYDGVQPE